MHSFIGLVHSLLAATGTTEPAGIPGMRWDGWMMLIIGILLLYGGLGCCLWIAAGRGKDTAWTEDEEDEEEQAV